MKLRSENREIEEKLREALGTAQHRGDVIKQIREELKQAQTKVHNVSILNTWGWVLFCERGPFPWSLKVVNESLPKYL